MPASPNPAELRSLARAEVGLERARTKWLRRWPPRSECTACGVTNPIALGRVRGRPLCYACKIRRNFEEHSLVGDHRRPRVITEPNTHKVQDEVQRIVRDALVPGVSLTFVAGLAAWVATVLTGLGTLEPDRP